MAGAYDVVIAGGIEHMTHTPMGSSVVRDLGFPFGPAMMTRYQERGGLVSQGISAELIADQWGPHARAARRVQRPFSGVRRHGDRGGPVRAGDHPARREGRRGQGRPTRPRRPTKGSGPDTTVEVLANLKPAFKPDGKVTAGNSSQITDGASAVLVMSEEKAAALGLTPRARFCAFALAGVDPVTMLTGPIPATKTVLERAKLSIDDIDLTEINEAFASVVLAWEKELHPDMSKVNVNGGAIAHRPPSRCIRSEADGDSRERARAHRRSLRTPDDVRRRRDGERHDHREARLSQPSRLAAPGSAASAVLRRQCRGRLTRATMPPARYQPEPWSGSTST